jgi:hypothetical protein
VSIYTSHQNGTCTNIRKHESSAPYSVKRYDKGFLSTGQKQDALKSSFQDHNLCTCDENKTNFLTIKPQLRPDTDRYHGDPPVSQFGDDAVSDVLVVEYPCPHLHG